MKKNLLLTLLSIFSFNIYAQVTFEKGHFITNSDEKVECLIKNEDLLNNPKSFIYKLSASTKEIKATINEVKAFEIYNTSKFERHTVNIDRSSEITDELSLTRKVEFKQEQLFLNVLVEGKATLYHYVEPNLSRFFYKKDFSEIEQLVYKSFTSDFGKTIQKNERFKQQLLNHFTCEGISNGKITSLKYQKKSLKNFFINYNECIGSTYTNYTFENSKTSKVDFNLTIRTGVNVSSLFLIDNSGNNIRNLNYGIKTPLITYGLELEVVLGFNNSKWSIIAQPNYQSYSSDIEDSIGRPNSATYNSIEIPLGLRHYFFLNETSKLFANALFIVDATFNSEIDTVLEKNLEPHSKLNFGLAAGYKYNDKFSLEFRIISTRDLLSIYSGHSAKYRSLSLVFGYTLF